VRTRRLLWILLFALPVVAVGCAQEEEVNSYNVDYPNREKLRLLTAIVPDAEMTWVFKLLGPEAAVAAQKEAFDDFVGSIRLKDKGNPKWTVPAGWKEEGGDGKMRFKTFRIDAGARAMEVAVTLLPKLTQPGDAIEPGKRNSILDNVNRWRGQMSLPEIGAPDLDKAVQKKTVDGREVTFFDVSAPGTYRVPVRNLDGGNPHADGALVKAPPMFGGDRNLPFTFKEPADWRPKRPLPQFSIAAFEVIEGNQRATVTVSQAGGDAVGNANRWREQVGLKKLPRAEMMKDLQPLKVAGMDAWYLDVANPNAPQPNNRILGVMVPTDQTTWFIKMAGPDALVGAQKTNFETFVKSFKLAQE
jgi:hypothetical protein